jgi:hypothetical protein
MNENDLYGNVEDDIGFLTSSAPTPAPTFTAGVVLRTYVADIRKLIAAMILEAKELPLKDSVRCRLQTRKYQLVDILDQIKLLSHTSDRLNTGNQGTIDGKTKTIK